VETDDNTSPIDLSIFMHQFAAQIRWIIIRPFQGYRPIAMGENSRNIY